MAEKPLTGVRIKIETPFEKGGDMKPNDYFLLYF